MPSASMIDLGPEPQGGWIIHPVAQGNYHGFFTTASRPNAASWFRAALTWQRTRECLAEARDREIPWHLLIHCGVREARASEDRHFSSGLIRLPRPGTVALPRTGELILDFMEAYQDARGEPETSDYLDRRIRQETDVVRLLMHALGDADEWYM